MQNRNILKKLLEQKSSHKISILIGPRQVGKTTLLKTLFNQLVKNNQCLFFDLDIYSNYEKIRTLENFINTLKLNSYQENQPEYYYVFLDEFQRYDDISIVMKNIYDHYPNIKIYASGSSSLTIKDQIQESLAGRKIINHIYPLSFEEFLSFKNCADFNNKINNLQSIKSNNIQEIIPELYPLLEEFLIFGGYPEVILANTVTQKIECLTAIFDLYVRKDLIDYLKIEKIKSAKTLLQFLAINNGKEIQYSEIAQIASLDVKTVKNYLSILEETYLILPLVPFYSNKNNEIRKSPKIYFIDNGVRNYFINNFNSLDIRDDASFLFEGHTIAELIKSGFEPSALKFWRTKIGEEVDIIVDLISKIIPIEIKYKKTIKSSDYKGLQTFISHYPKASKSFLINLVSNQSIGNIQLLSPFEISKLTNKPSENEQ